MHNSEIANFSISVNGFKWIESNQNSVLFQSIKKKFSFGKKISEILSKKVSTVQNLSDFFTFLFYKKLLRILFYIIFVKLS